MRPLFSSPAATSLAATAIPYGNRPRRAPPPARRPPPRRRPHTAVYRSARRRASHTRRAAP